MLFTVTMDTIALLMSFVALERAGHVYLHLYQLSSYQLQGYFRSLRARVTQYGLHVGLLVLVAVEIAYDLMRSSTPLLLDILILLFLVFLIWQYRPVPEKKPFVVTARVKRLIAVLVLVFLIILIAGSCIDAVQYTGAVALPGWERPRLLVVSKRCMELYLALIPLITALGGLIAFPMERMNNARYTRDAMRRLAEHPGLRVIGITGSFGKTSMKGALATLLSEGYKVLATPASYNTPMGVVRTIREQLTPMHDIFLCEMGARHVHDIKELTDIVHPDDGVLTSIGEQHLETFGSIDNIASTKLELFDAVLDKAGTVPAVGPDTHLMIANIDSEVVRDRIAGETPYRTGASGEGRATGTRLITYGFAEGADYRAGDVRVSADGTDFTVTEPSGETTPFRIRLVGRHNVTNVTGAIALAHELGIPMRKLTRAALRIEGVSHRLQLIRQGQTTILDDAYNSNPAGAGAALEVLSLIGATGTQGEQPIRILVTPGMVELGDKQAEANRQFAARAAGVCDHIIIVGRTNAQALKEGALSAGFPVERLYECADFTEASGEMMRLDAGRERVILLENDLPDDYK